MSMVLVLISVTSAAPGVRAVPLCDGDPVIEQVVTDLDAGETRAAAGALHPVRPCTAPEPATARLEAGRRAFYALDFDTAASELVLAARLAARATDSARQDVLTEAYALLVWSALEASAPATARGYARDLLHARPGVTLPTKVFPPHVVDLVTKVAAERTDTGSLEVTSRPPGGRLLVDGADRCVTPCVLHGMPAGAHHVVVRGATGAARAGTIEVHGATRVDLDLGNDTLGALVTALAAVDVTSAQRLRVEAFGDVQRLSAITRDTGGGLTVWIVDEGASELVTLRFASTATAAEVARAIGERKRSSANADAKSPPTHQPGVQVEVAAAGLLPVSQPQRDVFAVGGLAAVRLGYGGAIKAQLALGGATVLGRGDQEAAGVWQLSLGGALTLGWIRVEAHGGVALTGDVVRPWIDALAGLSPERLVVAPALMYVLLPDGAKAAARPGDAHLLGLGVLVAL